MKKNNNIYYEWITKIGPDILEFIDKFKILDAYYIESRYPPSLVNYSRKECHDALNIAKEIIGYINNKLPG